MGEIDFFVVEGVVVVFCFAGVGGFVDSVFVGGVLEGGVIVDWVFVGGELVDSVFAGAGDCGTDTISSPDITGKALFWLPPPPPLPQEVSRIAISATVTWSLTVFPC